MPHGEVAPPVPLPGLKAAEAKADPLGNFLDFTKE